MSIKGFVCFCPDLLMYRYKILDYSKEQGDAEHTIYHKFDENELLDSVAFHLKEGNKEAADFMSKITGLGRVNPHKVITFDTSNEKIDIHEPAAFWEAEEVKAKAREAAEEQGE